MGGVMATLLKLLLNPPRPSALLDAYASYSAGFELLTALYKRIPKPIQTILWSLFRKYFTGFRCKSIKTITIDEYWGFERNQLYDAAKLYLPTKIVPKSQTQIKMGKIRSQKNISVALPEEETVVDKFNNVKITWRTFSCLSKTSNHFENGDGSYQSSYEKGRFNLSFDSVHEKMITSTYLQHVLDVSASIAQKEKELKIYTLNGLDKYHNYHTRKNYTYLQHPASFDTIAMDPELKRSIIDDLDKFLLRKDYYAKIGKAWKRGYLFYGPPGTGKSSLVVAMAKYLKYDVYDLELSSISSNSQLRDVFLTMTSKSILVIEDIDCCRQVHDRSKIKEDPETQLELKEYKHSYTYSRESYTLSGILNTIDGLWSACGEERIIIFTTNHKDKLDPALLRPVRMDMHIELSYLKPAAFPALAFNYLGVPEGDNPLIDEIKSMLEYTKVTPASVAERLLRSDENADDGLRGVVGFLKEKRAKEVEDVAQSRDGMAALPVDASSSHIAIN